MNQLDVSPGDVLVNWTIDHGLGTPVSEQGEWPVFLGQIADNEFVPNEMISFFDTGFEKQGRKLKTGEINGRYAYQVACRSPDYRRAYNKLQAIVNCLDLVNRERVAADGNLYLFHNVTRINVLVAGQADDKQRWLVTSNGTALITQTS